MSTGAAAIVSAFVLLYGLSKKVQKVATPLPPPSPLYLRIFIVVRLVATVISLGALMILAIVDSDAKLPSWTIGLLILITLELVALRASLRIRTQYWVLSLVMIGIDSLCALGLDEEAGWMNVAAGVVWMAVFSVALLQRKAHKAALAERLARKSSVLAVDGVRVASATPSRDPADASPPPTGSPRRILDLRLARGEICLEEHEKLLAALEGAGPDKG